MSLKERLLAHVSCEAAARYLIENGLVKVNGHVITDYTIPADGLDTIEILNADPPLRLNAPESYWRARVMQERVGFVSFGDSVLHVEIRDGGFPLLVRDYRAEPYVITAKQFLNTKRIEGNPLTLTPGEIQAVTKARVDALVLELELDAFKVFQALERLLPALKSRGKLVVFLSGLGRDNKSLDEMARRFLPEMFVDVREVFPFKEGVYVYGKRTN
ncbi:MAG: hypothetical protein HYS81_03810 [Candidatus Aenigmatarchaeota archaeon]|nr:MAG: hypothetical protein HYS81_03810 [Candidatus Aenigmarchaeota archaeon]